MPQVNYQSACQDKIVVPGMTTYTDWPVISQLAMDLQNDILKMSAVKRANGCL